MINKEGILFTTVIAFFAILYIAQIIVVGYVITSKKSKHY